MPGKLSGKVDSIVQRPTQTGKVFHIVTVNGKEYSYWGQVDFSPGQTIEFDELIKGKYVNMGSPKVVAPGSETTSPTANARGGFAGRGMDADREARIVRQNASSTAVALIGASKVAGKQDVESLLGLLKETSKRIFQMNMEGYESGSGSGNNPTGDSPSDPKSKEQVKADAEELFG